MDVSIPRRAHSNDWPISLSLSPRSGLLLLLIVVLIDRVWRYSRIVLRPYISSDTVLDWIVEVGVLGLLTLALCVAIQSITGASITKILGFQTTNPKDLLKWGYVALVASSYNLALEIPSGFGPQYESELWFICIRLISTVLLIPFYEELIYRFLIYGMIRSRFGRWPAAIVSTTIFFFFHQSVHRVLATSSWMIVVLFINLSFFGLLAAYLYETRRTLLPCVVIHAAINLTYQSAPLIGYLIGGTIAKTARPRLP